MQRRRDHNYGTRSQNDGPAARNDKRDVFAQDECGRHIRGPCTPQQFRRIPASWHHLLLSTSQEPNVKFSIFIDVLIRMQFRIPGLQRLHVQKGNMQSFRGRRLLPIGVLSERQRVYGSEHVARSDIDFLPRCRVNKGSRRRDTEIGPHRPAAPFYCVGIGIIGGIEGIGIPHTLNTAVRLRLI